jgi:hypothetical protein
MFKTTVSALALLTAMVAANPSNAMQFTRVASGNNVTIHMSGEIDPGDADRFATFMQTLPATDHVVAFTLDSPGGVVGEAMKMGMTIVTNGAATVLPANVTCSSACFWLFAAGQHREMVASAQLGVHGARNSNGTEATDGTVEMARFGHEIGIPDSIIVRLVTTPPNKMAWLTPRELTEMGVEIVSPKSTAWAVPAPALPPVASASLPPTSAPAPTTHMPVPASTDPTQAFAQGRADRQAYEAWFVTLPESSQTKEGALYWASVRSTPKAAIGCYGPGYTGTPEQKEWGNGCMMTKNILDPTDYKRLTNPSYRAGWNSVPDTGNDVPPNVSPGV